MTDDASLQSKRTAIGLFALVCLTGAVVLVAFPGHEGLQGALVRVGILLSAFWLVLGRPPRWKAVQSNWLLVAAIAGALLVRQAKAIFPVAAVIVAIAFFARPRNKNKTDSDSRG